MDAQTSELETFRLSPVLLHFREDSEGSRAEPPFLRWRARVSNERARSLAMPLEALASEARIAADFVVRRWSGKRDAAGRVALPGLEDSEPAFKLESGIATEVVELLDAVFESQRRYEARRRDGARLSSRKARSMLASVRLALEPVCADAGSLRPLDDRSQHESAHRDLIAKLERALELLQAYGSHPDVKAFLAPSLPLEIEAELQALRTALFHRALVAEELRLRNRLAQALLARIGRVRRAARKVFHNHPTIVREVTSAYERHRRARHRARARVSARPQTLSA